MDETQMLQAERRNKGAAPMASPGRRVTKHDSINKKSGCAPPSGTHDR